MVASYICTNISCYSTLGVDKTYIKLKTIILIGYIHITVMLKHK